MRRLIDRTYWVLKLCQEMPNEGDPGRPSLKIMHTELTPGGMENEYYTLEAAAADQSWLNSRLGPGWPRHAIVRVTVVEELEPVP